MLCIPDILTVEDLQEIQIQIGRGRFVDGRWTAGGSAAEAKRNQILDAPDDRIDRIAVNALIRNSLFDAYVAPWRFAPPQVARYEVGMSYGPHLDAALMGQSPRMRCDLSITLFLNQPADYEGGELVVMQETGESRTKLAAGSAVIYPADTLHRVEPVRRGERLVFVTWVQSHLRDQQIRRMLFDLSQVIDELENGGADPSAVLRMIGIQTNLYRKFAET